MTALRIAYVSNGHPPYSTENDVREAFSLLGHDVVMLQENETPWQTVREEALASDLLLWTGTWDDAQPLAESLTTFKLCTDAGIPTATLHLDTFWPTVRGGRQWWLAPMMHTGHILTADGDWDHKWMQLGKRHHWLPPAVRHSACFDGERRDEFVCDVAFVGSNGHGYHEDVWPYRRDLVDALRSMCARRGWVFRNPGGDEPKVDRDRTVNDFYASATVTVGDSLCVDREKSRYWSDRVPEATGRGGFLIMPQIDWLHRLYPGLPTYPWGDYDALERVIERGLTDGKWREGIRAECAEITRGRHTYVNRATEIMQLVGLS